MDDRVLLAELLVVAATSVWLLLIGHALRPGRQKASSEIGNHQHAVPVPNNDVMSADVVRVCGAWVPEDGVRLLISILIRDGSPEALQLAQDLARIFLMARDKDFIFTAGQREVLLAHIPEPLPTDLWSLHRALLNDPEITKRTQRPQTGEPRSDVRHSPWEPTGSSGR